MGPRKSLSMRRCMLRRGLYQELVSDGGEKLGGCEGYVPASSVTMARPTGCVAPVTTHMKPYCFHDPPSQFRNYHDYP
jgi:hypothetical protein